jgi:hypothetical protein
MPHAFFHITEVNPNDTTGGGGCICSPSQEIDCVGPYAVFPGNDMENIVSPHVVVGVRCLKAALRSIEENEPLSAGERMTYADVRAADRADLAIEQMHALELNKALEAEPEL